MIQRRIYFQPIRKAKLWLILAVGAIVLVGLHVVAGCAPRVLFDVVEAESSCDVSITIPQGDRGVPLRVVHAVPDNGPEDLEHEVCSGVD